MLGLKYPGALGYSFPSTHHFPWLSCSKNQPKSFQSFNDKLPLKNGYLWLFGTDGQLCHALGQLFSLAIRFPSLGTFAILSFTTSS